MPGQPRHRPVGVVVPQLCRKVAPVSSFTFYPSRLKTCQSPVINSVEAEASTIRFFISIERTGANVLQWYADNAPESKDTIFLLSASGRVFHLVDTGGVFAQDTELQPGEIYSGWISFDRPEDNQFTFYYPDMEPILITLSQISSR